MAGLAFGFAFIYFYKKGVDLSKPFNKIADQIVSIFNKKPKMKVTYVNKDKRRNNKTNSNVDQTKVDAILDKISQEGGYNNLTKAEKDYLFKASNN